MDYQPLYPLPPIDELSACRGSILVLGVRSLRSIGRYEEYAAALSPRYKSEILTATAGSWVPLHLIRDHCRGIDALNLAEAEIRHMGEEIGNAVHGAFIATLVRLAGQAGFSPWLPLKHCYKLWTRSWHGGAITVSRVTGSAAEVAIIRTPLCDSRFFCYSFAGAIAAGVEPFCKKPHARVIQSALSADSMAFHLSW